MRREALERARRQVRDGRVALACLLLLSVASNLALALAIGASERTTVLVPAVRGAVWEVSGGRADRRYLEDMARTVAVTLLSLTPENAAHVRAAAARMSHASARGAIGAWVTAEAERMARRDIATAFWPGRIEAQDDLSVTVEGELATWMGREPVSQEERRYRLVFRIDGGRIGLARFEELEN